MLIELIDANHDIKYGLVNGVKGFFAGFITLENGVICIEFSNPTIDTI